MGKYDYLKKGFERAKEKAREIPEVAEYLDSMEVAVGRMILSRRIELGYTQDELAELADVMTSELGAIELGLGHKEFGIEVSADSVNKVIRVLKIKGLRPIYDEEAAAYAM